MAYLADDTNLVVIDLSDEANPAVTTLPQASAISALAVDGSLLLSARSGAVFDTWDISQPASPLLVGSAPAGGSAAQDIAARFGRSAFVSPSAVGLLDTSAPSAPFVSGWSDPPQIYHGVGTERDLAFAPNILAYHSIDYFDLSGPTPIRLGSIDLGPFGVSDTDGRRIDARDGVLYEAARVSLVIARYAQFDPDPGAAPEVEILSPVTGATTREGSVLPIQVVARDDYFFDHLDVLVDGIVVGRFYESPADLDYIVRRGVGQLTITAIARDRAGNEGTAGPVSVTVDPDLSPSVTLRSPSENAAVYEGDQLFIQVAASDDVPGFVSEILVDGSVVATSQPASGNSQYFQISHPVPVGSADLRVQGAVTDTVGVRTTTTERTVQVRPNAPPLVAILEPGDQQVFPPNQLFDVTVLASDELGEPAIDLYLDGGLVAQGQGEIETLLSSPDEGDHELRAVATDALGVQSTATVQFSIAVVDPLTTVVGTVVDEAAAPVNGATASVNVQGSIYSAVTASDGTFTIPSVPALKGSFKVDVTWEPVPGEVYVGSSATVTPVGAGVTDVGTITMRPESALGVLPMFPVPTVVWNDYVAGVGAGDMNGDGLPDIVASLENGTGHEVGVALALEDGTFGPFLQRAPATGGLWNIETGDLDGDGNIDVLAPGFDGRLYLLLGDGQGNLGPATQVRDLGDERIAVADLDGDGDLDVVSAFGLAPGTIGVMINDGSGGFSELSFTFDSSLSRSENVAIGNFDGDAYPDVAVAPLSEASVSIHLSNGSPMGDFANPIAVPTIVNVSRVLAGDLDGDGLDDLAAIGGSNSTDIFTATADGGGGFTPLEVLTLSWEAPWMAELGDLDGSGTDDIVMVPSYTTVYLTTRPDGTTQSPIELGDLYWGTQGGTGLSVIDLNRDGLRDILLSSGSWGRQVYAVYSLGADGMQYPFAQPFLTGGYGPRSAAAGRLSCDPAPDLAAQLDTTVDYQLVSLPGDGEGGLGSPLSIGNIHFSSYSSTEVADFTGDGVSDILAAHPSASGMGLYAGDGDGGFTLVQSYPQSSVFIETFDANGDEAPDVLVIYSDLQVWINDGAGVFTIDTLPATNPSLAATGDLNGDGHADVVSLGYQSPGYLIELFLGDGSGGFTLAPAPTAAGLQRLAVGDLNEDGYDDLLVETFDPACTRYEFCSALDVYPGSSNGPVDPPTRIAIPSHPRTWYEVAIGFEDIDGDGHSDLVYQTYDLDTLFVVLGNGDLTMGPAFSFMAGNSSLYGHTVADLTLDGAPEFILGNRRYNLVLKNQLASASPLYGATGPLASPPGQVQRLDRKTADPEALGTPVVTGGLSGLAFDPGGRLWALTDEGPSAPSRLIEVDPDTGALLADLGPVVDDATQSGLTLGDLAASPDGTLYAVGTAGVDPTAAGILFSIDPSTAQATRIGGNGEALALAFYRSVLFGSFVDGVGNPYFARLDPATGSVSDVKATTEVFDGLAMFPDGAAYASRAGDGQVFYVVPAHGCVSPLGGAGVSDLATRPQPGGTP